MIRASGSSSAPSICNPPTSPAGIRVESGRAKWAEGHIPGAGFVDLQEELSDRTCKLRFMMPPAAQFAEAMGRARRR